MASRTGEAIGRFMRTCAFDRNKGKQYRDCSLPAFLPMKETKIDARNTRHSGRDSCLAEGPR
jgi:hypothetical protein